MNIGNDPSGLWANIANLTTVQTVTEVTMRMLDEKERGSRDNDSIQFIRLHGLSQIVPTAQQTQGPGSSKACAGKKATARTDRPVKKNQ